jgi:cytochrome b subunit of formate dehydrogenase
MELKREENSQAEEEAMPMTTVAEPEPKGTPEAFIRRFSPLEIGLHISVVVSFLGLALTGLILKYSEASWARALAWLLGGVPAAAAFHRFFALITFGYFFTHLFVLIQRFWEGFRRGEIVLSWDRVFGPNSMIPRWQDFQQFAEQFAWFLRLRREPPKFDRWTYFEKFDYWAVFWGVAVIGLSGLILWFKNFFTQILPGWILNVAFIVHSEEALLAVGFIFAIHFFNTHLRPESFPLDLVIFLGVMPEEEHRLKHPAEYERLVREGKLDKRRVPPPPTWAKRLARAFGLTALGTGLALLVLIFLTSLGLIR